MPRSKRSVRNAERRRDRKQRRREARRTMQQLDELVNGPSYEFAVDYSTKAVWIPISIPVGTWSKG